jgi:oligopeptide transport system substrate-binding protein
MRRYGRLGFAGALGIIFFLGLVAFMRSPTAAESPTLIEANRNKILLLTVGSEPKSLDPSLVEGIPDGRILAALVEGLVITDPKDASKQDPGVAESWDHNEDASVWTFHIRPDAKWSNGDPVTANDFVFGFQRVLTAQLGSINTDFFFVFKGAEAYLRGKITNFGEVGIKAVDPHTLRFDLIGPDPCLTTLLAAQQFYPVHPPTILKFGTIGQRDTKWTAPGNYVGNGPFVLKTWRKNDVLEVVKNPNYWDAAKVKLNGIRFYAIQDIDTADRAFRAGQLHKTDQVPLDRIPYYRREQPEILQLAPYLGVYFYNLNVGRKPLDNPKVRLALSLSIDRLVLVQNVLRAKQQPATGFVPPGLSDYPVARKISFDPGRARQLLAESGYPGGRGFPKLSIVMNTSQTHRTVAEAIQQMWREELNIDVGIENQEWKVYMDTLTKHHFDIGRIGWIGTPDPTFFLDIWKTGNPNNMAGWSNVQYDNLINTAEQTGDLTRRLALLHQAEDLFLSDSPVIPIYWYTSAYLLHPSVLGWYSNILDDHPYKFVDLKPLGEGLSTKLTKSP